MNYDCFVSFDFLYYKDGGHRPDAFPDAGKKCQFRGHYISIRLDDFYVIGNRAIVDVLPASAREMNIETNTNKKQDKMIFFILASPLGFVKGAEYQHGIVMPDTDVRN